MTSLSEVIRDDILPVVNVIVPVIGQALTGNYGGVVVSLIAGALKLARNDADGLKNAFRDTNKLTNTVNQLKALDDDHHEHFVRMG